MMSHNPFRRYIHDVITDGVISTATFPSLKELVINHGENGEATSGDPEVLRKGRDLVNGKWIE